MIKKILVILAILFALFVIFVFASIKYTERPEFCLSCHIMKPYYDSWKKSGHGKESCLECHYEPGLKAHILGKINGLVEVAKYLTGKYAVKYSAKVNDLTCLRQGCHIREAVSAGKAVLKGKVGFDHGKHFNLSKDGFISQNRAMELNCTNCHNQLTDEEHIAIDENTCFICHFKNIEGEQLAVQCLKCHPSIKETDSHKLGSSGLASDKPEGDGLASFGQSHSQSHKEYLKQADATCIGCHNEAKKGGGEVLKQLCLNCHADKTKISKIGKAKEVHDIHMKENRANCRDCHHIIEHN